MSHSPDLLSWPQAKDFLNAAQNRPGLGGDRRFLLNAQAFVLGVQALLRENPQIVGFLVQDLSDHSAPRREQIYGMSVIIMTLPNQSLDEEAVKSVEKRFRDLTEKTLSRSDSGWKGVRRRGFIDADSLQQWAQGQVTPDWLAKIRGVALDEAWISTAKPRALPRL